MNKIMFEISDFEKLTDLIDAFFCCENKEIEIVIQKENSTFYVIFRDEQS